MHSLNRWYLTLVATTKLHRSLIACSISLIAWLVTSLCPLKIAVGQVIQLPSQHIFSSSGSVLVPDGGTASLGGIGHARDGAVRSGFGPLSNRASVSNLSGSSMSASVQIIDLEALDEAILTKAAPSANSIAAGANSGLNTPRIASASSPLADSATALAIDTAVSDQSFGYRPDTLLTSKLASSRDLASPTSQRVGDDPGKWQRILSGEGYDSPSNLSLEESDIRYYVQLGEQAERAGSYESARVYFRLARQAMSPELAEHYQRIVAVRTADAAARSKAEQNDARRKF